jgi:histidinol phosphatase-like PHP family hydrolase
LDVVFVAEDTCTRLPDELLEYLGIATHLHPSGNSACSGQQSVPDIVHTLTQLGICSAVITPHTGNPSSLMPIAADGKEIAVLRTIADEVEGVKQQTDFDIVFGLECNTVPGFEGTTNDPRYYRLDMSEQLITSLGSNYTIGSLHGSKSHYQEPAALLAAIRMLCEHPCVDSLGHITRSMWEVDIDWHEVGIMASATGTLIELNLNQWFKELGQNEPLPSGCDRGNQFRHFFEVTATSGAYFVIGLDAHNAGMYPRPVPSEGWETTTIRCLDFIHLLQESGIDKEHIVSTSTQQWDSWMASSKHS